MSPVLLSQLFQLLLAILAVAVATVGSGIGIRALIRSIHKHRDGTENIDEPVPEDVHEDVHADIRDLKLANVTITVYQDVKHKSFYDYKYKTGSRSKTDITTFKGCTAAAIKEIIESTDPIYGITMKLAGGANNFVVKFDEMSSANQQKFAILKKVSDLCIETAATNSELKSGEKTGIIPVAIQKNIEEWVERANNGEVFDVTKIDLTKSPEAVLGTEVIHAEEHSDVTDLVEASDDEIVLSTVVTDHETVDVSSTPSRLDLTEEF